MVYTNNIQKNYVRTFLNIFASLKPDKKYVQSDTSRIKPVSEGTFPKLYL